MLGIARIAENGLLAASFITAAIAFLGVLAFDTNVMFGLLLSPVCIMLSSAVLAFVLLRHQEQAALTAAMIAGGLVVLAALITQQYAVQILVYTGLCWMGSLVVAGVLRLTVSLKLAVLATVPVTVFVGLFGLAFKAQIIHFFQASWLESIAKFSEAELQALDSKNLELMQKMPELLAESIGSWAFFIVLSSVFVSRYWQAQLFNPGGFQKEFHSLRLGKEAVIACVAALGLSLVFSSSFFAVISSALIFVFFIQGLSVLHCLTKQRGLSRSWLTGLYVILWLPPTMLLLSILGMVENFFHLRKL